MRFEGPPVVGVVYLTDGCIQDGDTAGWNEGTAGSITPATGSVGRVTAALSTVRTADAAAAVCDGV
jgi:hypothetical protein